MNNIGILSSDETFINQTKKTILLHFPTAKVSAISKVKTLDPDNFHLIIVDNNTEKSEQILFWETRQKQNSRHNKTRVAVCIDKDKDSLPLLQYNTIWYKKEYENDFFKTILPTLKSETNKPIKVRLNPELQIHINDKSVFLPNRIAEYFVYLVLHKTKVKKYDILFDLTDDSTKIKGTLGERVAAHSLKKIFDECGFNTKELFVATSQGTRLLNHNLIDCDYNNILSGKKDYVIVNEENNIPLCQNLKFTTSFIEPYIGKLTFFVEQNNIKKIPELIKV